MKTETIDTELERPVLISLITSVEVLGKISPIWEKDFFFSEWSNMVGHWCVHHYRKYGTAPRDAMQGYFRVWHERKGRLKPELSKEIEKFLAGLSDEYLRTDSNPALLVDNAHTHFNKVRISRLYKELKNDVEAKDFDKAQERVLTYSKLAINEEAGFDLLNDEYEVRSTMEKKEGVSTIEYPDGLGRFFGDILSRDQFFAFLAAEKVGKSWWMIDLAWRALEQRWKVAFFAVGDMSKEQVKKRFLSRACNRPWRSPNGKWPYVVKIPDTLDFPEVGKVGAEVASYEKVFDKPFDGEMAWKACKDVIQKKVCSDIPYLKISVHPTSSIGVEGIRAILQSWSLRGWDADCVVIDYADILANPKGRFEKERDAISANWKQLRALSTERHCLVVTATQANRESYDKPLLDRRNLSEDKRKLAEVTGMAGINVVGEEKELGLYRLNWIALREQEYSTRKCCYVAGCLPIGNPAVLSVF